MRVLYVIDSLGYGGAERSLVQLLPHYKERGVDTTIACLRRRDKSQATIARQSGAVVIEVPEASIPKQAQAVHRLAKGRAAELIHTTLFRSDIVGRLASIGLRTPVLTSLVNTQYEPDRQAEAATARWKLELARQIETWSGWLLTDHFHANSVAVLEAGRKRLRIPERSITVVPRGRDPETYSPVAQSSRGRIRRELDILPDDLVVLNVGRQEPQKGQIHLLKAFALVVRSFPDSRLVMVGRPGAATAQLHDAVQRLGLKNHTTFLSRRDDMPEILGAADIFALPSLWEGLPNVVIEAMAVGIPVVASDIPPVREAVEAGASALLVPKADPDALASTLCSLIVDVGLRERLGRYGRAVFLERFTIGPVADRMVAMYRDLVRQGSGK